MYTENPLPPFPAPIHRKGGKLIFKIYCAASYKEWGNLGFDDVLYWRGSAKASP